MHSNSPFDAFSNEVLLMIFSEMDISTLLSLSSTCKDFRRLANICLSKIFKEQNVGLTLKFDQEHKWRSDLLMEFDHVNEKNGNFIFRPKEENSLLRFYHSALLKKPNIYKISLNNVTTSPTNQQEKENEDATQNDETNLLQKSVGISIKTRDGICQKIQNVYRMGNGSSHLKVPFIFTYSVVDIPPPNETKSRGGERWITPLSFECPPSFFYPDEAVFHRFLMSIMRITKKQSTEKTIVSDASQKERISFQKESRNRKPILQQIPQINLYEKKKFSRWLRGARQ